ncbi:GIY-YIG nuclease family protein [Rosenbergiella australiborealis]|uniref:GIY-YIG nuclease family protein n=1 Tax=Rosenbergiella australiborealis TaxID=1544696 RepID=A0ABS5T0L9_9GAMM|nr:GIY-YIG nuclease family protein [Rosenbergiella australiborealis]MBT0725889.1 GIY-YIG nuclease family protein [Rosenbergiella australiborealis]
MYQNTPLQDYKPQWSVYLIQTAKGAFYTGISTDVFRRFGEHERGRGAKALRGRGPLTLVFQCSVGDRADALRLEYRIKQLSHLKKLEIVRVQPADISEWLK